MSTEELKLMLEGKMAKKARVEAHEEALAADRAAKCASARAAATYAVLVFGATGIHANDINGIYEVLPAQVACGMPIYEKMGAKWYLEYVESSRRWISTGHTFKGQAIGAGPAFVNCDISQLPDKATSSAWHVLDGVESKFKAQASVVVSPLTSQDVIASKSVRAGVCISGAIGITAGSVNGLYEVTDEISGGMPVYKKQEADVWLEYHVASRQWMLRHKSFKGQESKKCFAFVTCSVDIEWIDQAPGYPWRVYDGEWVTQPQVTVTPMSASKMTLDIAAAAVAVQSACAAARNAATYAVRISGATGITAGRVNGIYEVTDEISGGLPVYKKQEAEMWLEYHIKGSQWMLRLTANKGQESDLCNAHVACAIGLLPDKAPTGAWRAKATQTRLVAVSPVSAADVAAELAAVHAACSIAQKAATYAVRISGATGNDASFVNGLYEVTDEISGGMPVYKKMGAEMWLEYNVTDSQWMLRLTAQKGQANFQCLASLDCAIGLLPDEAPTVAWHLNLVNAQVVLTNVTVKSASAKEVRSFKEFKERQVFAAASAAAVAAATYAVRIRGVTGSFADYINGVYDVKKGAVSGGMPVYKKRGDEQWLEYHVA